MPNFEQYFVRGDDRKKFYWSIDKREAKQRGWIEEDKTAEAPAPKPIPEVAVEVGSDAFDMEAKVEEPSESLNEMTKAELLDWALERGVDLPNNDRKADILAACKEIEQAS